ncbi:hypothetical protein CUJ83_14490 [Methanocella sp. CWC-04]|uniref:Uncharacterized protein n=1 Tax=Methanooceanicella nereidis TaxID=2052831 RepID=A0AAP2RF59_9EURY|nr:hypothetical protein [Methanocella sp. CWC-04]MCD1296208.1 hypothetical protein [Methanocella sp. CWC-04]
MYISLAVHKNELVVVDSMQTFSNYFCLAKKQKMTPLATNAPVMTAEDLRDEMKPYFEDGSVEDVAEEDDDL